jgi:hypothetical protein
MEKDIGRLPKNQDTEIVIRIDDFGGRRGLTIREFVKSEGYTGFTKAGVRIRAEDFEVLKVMINSIDPKDFIMAEPTQGKLAEAPDDDDAGIDEDGCM